MTFVVGITGGIGSGKSAVTNHLETLGIVVVDADVVARQVVEPGRPALQAIEEHFGPSVIQSDGTLDRAALRKIVFESPEERMWLERLTHPKIREEISEQLAAANSAYAVLSSPLLLEAGQSAFANYVVVVDVPEDMQISRTAARDNNTEELVKKIMAAQLPREERCARADEVIDNSGSLETLYTVVEDLHSRLLAKAGAAEAPGVDNTPPA